MKRRILKKKVQGVLNGSLPTIFKVSALNVLVTKGRVKNKSNRFLYIYNSYTVCYSRIGVTNHKGLVTVSEGECISEIGFSIFRNALIWVSKYGKADTEYFVDSGHYRYCVTLHP